MSRYCYWTYSFSTDPFLTYKNIVTHSKENKILLSQRFHTLSKVRSGVWQSQKHSSRYTKMYPLYLVYAGLIGVVAISHSEQPQTPLKNQTQMTERLFCIEAPDDPSFQGLLAGPAPYTCPYIVSFKLMFR